MKDSVVISYILLKNGVIIRGKSNKTERHDAYKRCL